MFKKSLSPLFLLLSSLVITGCDNAQDTSTTQSTEKQTLTIEHAQGTTEIPAHPQKVVVMNMETLDIVDALGIAHADAVDDDFPSRRLFQIVDAAQDRTLAGTGRADDDDDFFILNGQVDALQDFVLAKTFFQTFNFYHPLRTSVPNSLRDGQWSKS